MNLVAYDVFKKRMLARAEKLLHTATLERSFIHEVLETIDDETDSYESTVRFAVKHCHGNVEALSNPDWCHPNWLETLAWDVRLLEDAYFEEHQYNAVHTIPA